MIVSIGLSQQYQLPSLIPFPGFEAHEIYPRRQSRAIEEDVVDAGGVPVVLLYPGGFETRPYIATVDVEHLEFDLARDGKRKGQRGGRIEGIGVGGDTES